MRWRAATLGGLVASIVAAVLVSERALQARDEHLRPSTIERFVPPPAGARFLPLGDRVHVDGLPRQLAYALSPDPAAKVASRYAGMWTSQGLIVEERRVGDELWVSARERAGASVRTVVATPREGGSLVLASVSTLLGAAERQLELPPGCRTATRTGATDRGAVTEAQLAACARPPEEVWRDFERLLGPPTRVSAPGIRRWESGAGNIIILAAPVRVGAEVHTALTIALERWR